MSRRKSLGAEAQLQISCVQWFKSTYPEFSNLIIYVNNNSSNPRRGQINKLMGVLAGFPDVFLFLGNKEYFGLAIEFKVEGKKPRANQLLIHAKLKQEGYAVEVITTLTAFKNLIQSYVNKV